MGQKQQTGAQGASPAQEKSVEAQAAAPAERALNEPVPGAGEPPRARLGQWLRERFSDTQRYLIIWGITGVACGLAAVAFHIAIDTTLSGMLGVAGWLGGQRLWLMCLWLVLLPTLGGLLTGWLLARYTPESAGSGIPQTKERFYRKFGVFRAREVIWRFVLGTLSIGSGMSLGREGPTVHLCAALASTIGQYFGLAKKRVQAMVPLGMGAGIAAAFNTPMAAVFFVFEELLGDFSSKSFFGLFMVVVLASVTQRLIMGEHPAFEIAETPLTTDAWMLLAIPLGIVSALLGKLFIVSLLRARAGFRGLPLVPTWMRPGLGGLSVGVIGVAVLLYTDGHLGIFGMGYADASAMLNGQMTWIAVALALLAGKFVATVLAYSSGGSGGLFAPTLFLGAMLGGVLALAGQGLFGYDATVVGAMALLGMGSLFAAVIRCPMTSIMIIWEMTGQYQLILPLMVGNGIAYVLSHRLQPIPLYDALLLQDKINLRKLPSYQGNQDWRNLPVSSIMTFDVVVVRAEWTPQKALAWLEESGQKHHAYPVVDALGELRGMICHHELIEDARDAPERTLGEAVRRQKTLTVQPEQSIRDVAQALVVRDVLQVPVVSGREPRKVLGIVTLHDIARQQNAIDQSLGR